MSSITLAMHRTSRSLGQRQVWVALLAPAAVALITALAFKVWLFDGLVDFFVTSPPLSWGVHRGWGSAAQALAWIASLLTVMGASYLVATLIAAIFVLPWLVRLVAPVDYADLARLGRDGFFAGLWNSVTAAVGYLAGWLVTWPLWLIPGMALVLPLLWLAWYNRRTFAWDALALHATDEETQMLRREHRGRLLMIGSLPAVLAHVPLVGLLAPGLAALLFVHYTLEALRDMRAGNVGVY